MADKTKTLALLFLSMLILSTLSAQNFDFRTLFANAMQTHNEKVGKALFKGQILKGKRNGMGIMAYKNGDYYIGDFCRDKITGFGMFLSDVGRIDKCDGCYVYVGNWKDGKKSGMGRCYDNQGQLIYSGRFSDDAPSEQYPTADVDNSKSFTVSISEKKNCYVGETEGGVLNGYGVFVFNDGNIWITQMKDDSQTGVGLLVYANGEWATVNYKNDELTIISTSEYYRTVDDKRKAITRAAIKGALTEFSHAVNTASTLVRGGTDISSDRQDVAEVDENDVSSVGAGSSYKKRCSECGGTGKCSGSHGCRGTRNCYWCQGDGFTKIVAGEKVKCAKCGGTGSCQYCHATGKCRKCNGTGVL